MTFLTSKNIVTKKFVLKLRTFKMSPFSHGYTPVRNPGFASLEGKHPLNTETLRLLSLVQLHNFTLVSNPIEDNRATLKSTIMHVLKCLQDQGLEFCVVYLCCKLARAVTVFLFGLGLEGFDCTRKSQ